MNIKIGEHPTPHFFLQFATLLPMLFAFIAILKWFYLTEIASLPFERAITFELPSLPKHTRVLSPDTLIIDIDADGSVSISGVLSEPYQSSNLLELRRFLLSSRDTINRHGGLIVRPNPSVDFQRLIDVLSAVTSSGIIYYGLS